MELKKGKIKLPILKAYDSEFYPLILDDSAGLSHYFNFDGTYDGYSHETGTDGETGICKN